MGFLFNRRNRSKSFACLLLYFIVLPFRVIIVDVVRFAKCCTGFQKTLSISHNRWNEIVARRFLSLFKVAKSESRTDLNSNSIRFPYGGKNGGKSRCRVWNVCGGAKNASEIRWRIKTSVIVPGEYKSLLRFFICVEIIHVPVKPEKHLKLGSHLFLAKLRAVFDITRYRISNFRLKSRILPTWLTH